MKPSSLPQVLKHQGALWLRYLYSLGEAGLSAFTPFIVTTALIAAVSLFNLVTYIPAAVHLWLLALALAAMAVTGFQGWQRFHWPRWTEVLSRLERENRLSSGSLRSLAEHLPENVPEESAALWRYYRAENEAAAHRLAPGRFRNEFLRRDRYGLSFLLVFSLAVGVWSHPQAWKSLRTFFALEPPAITASHAWPDLSIELPAYLDPQSSILLNSRDIRFIDRVPLNSHFVLKPRQPIRAYKVTLGWRQMDLAPSEDGTYKVRLARPGRYTLRVFEGWRMVHAWEVHVQSDKPPAVMFTAEPAVTQRHNLEVSYEIHDDFGADKVMLRVESPGHRPRFHRLSLPQAAVQSAKLTSYVDMAEAPFAGQEAELRLMVTDRMGQQAFSEPVRALIPTRTFQNPVARRLIELRQLLYKDGVFARPTIWPEIETLSRDDIFKNSPVDSMAMRVLSQRLFLDQKGQDLESAQQLMWDIATHIEDGGVSLVERDLRALEERIRETLRQGGDPRQLVMLMEQYKRLLAQYIQATLRDIPPLPSYAGTAQSYALEAGDLMNFIEYMQRLAASGQMEDFNQMFAQLQQIMQNLQKPQAPHPDAQKFMAILQEIRKLMGEQDALLQKTFQRKESAQDSPALDTALTRDQENISARIEAVRQDFSALAPSQPPEFRAAKEFSELSVFSLREAEWDPAAKAQGQTLSNLQKLFQSLLQQSMQGQGQGGQRMSLPGVRSQDDERIEIPQAGGASPLQKLIEQIRGKMSDPALEEIERRYFENLLDIF